MDKPNRVIVNTMIGEVEVSINAIPYGIKIYVVPKVYEKCYEYTGGNPLNHSRCVESVVRALVFDSTIQITRSIESLILDLHNTKFGTYEANLEVSSLIRKLSELITTIREIKV